MGGWKTGGHPGKRIHQRKKHNNRGFTMNEQGRRKADKDALGEEKRGPLWVRFKLGGDKKEG